MNQWGRVRRRSHPGPKDNVDTLRKNDIKLNLLKCTFGMKSGKFLGCMVNKRGIEANRKGLRHP